MQPYRVPPETRPQTIGDDAWGDADLLPLFVVVWVGSLARVWIALANREVFSIEATAALLFALGAPVLFKDWAVGWWRRRGGRSSAPPSA
jgi:hypothetical protein